MQKNAINPETYEDELLRGCAGILAGKKAERTVALNLAEVNSYFDYFIIATGSSSIHCKSLARDISKYMSAHGRKTRSKPDTNSSWIILDYDDIVLHIFTEDARDYYQLEKLWGDAVRVSL
ncbi:MAG: ribosome silencing factor [Spirochaetia bacterium]|jgi:ribosome-associated protein|nr:ribosome silencing factor [Spirochaetia bacterium]